MAAGAQQAEGRVALVTGGARRLGAAIASALARHGWDVVVHFRHSRDDALRVVGDVESAGRRAVAVGCDLSRGDEVDGLLDACERALGPVRCLVNNASVFEFDTAATFSRQAFDLHMATNLAAPVRLAQLLHARMPEDARGVVVNLLDQKLWNPNPDFFSYTLSKAALEAATGLMARSLAPKLRVVGVAPGISLPSPGQSQAGFEAAFRETPLGRSSTPEDIAGAVAFLAEAPAITGTTLLVDGGQHLVPSARDVVFSNR